MMALAGAHFNNLFFEEGFNLDMADDQYSIKLGREYAKLAGWKTNYVGKNNIFRN